MEKGSKKKLPFVNDDGDILSAEEVDSLYATLAQQLWAIFYAKCSDHSVADDVLSEAFTRLMAYSGTGVRNPRAWLIHVGKNLLVDHKRREKQLKNTIWAARPIACETVPSDELISGEARDIVRDSLKDLSEDYRLILILRYGLGYSTKRICDVTENSVAAADMQISRARRRLAEALAVRGVKQLGDLIPETANL